MKKNKKTYKETTVHAEQRQPNPSRRGLLLGSATATAMMVWHKPIINQVVLPAHAQMSPMCPALTTGNVLFAPVSGTQPGEPERCSVEFEVLSSDANTPLNIVSITNNALSQFTEVQYSGFGEATADSGPRVVWRGESVDAPFCNDIQVINEVTFTVTATCNIAGAPEIEQSFTLTEVLAG